MKAVRFVQRRNLGPYEHRELEIQESIEDNQDKVSVVKELINFTKNALYGTGPFSEDAQVQTTATTTKIPEATTTVAKVRKTADKVVETPPVQTELPLENKTAQATTTQENKPIETKVETKVAEEKKPEEVKETVKKPETKLKVKATTTTLYDRELDAHKNNMGVWLDSEFPKWRDAANLPKFGKASRALHGVAQFLDAQGEILDAFKVEFRKYVSGEK
jgi:hypothetical protein